MTTSEHELLTFRRVNSALDRINFGMEVQYKGPLAEALGELGCFPYAKVPCDDDCELSIGGKPAGTFEKPDVDLILQESTVSSFGRGHTTVLDPSYRHGREISAPKMSIVTNQTNRYFSRASEDEISAAMFVGKTVKLKFYKLAVYEEGGHFDWHMDTTHSDQHHATFLLALNTSWEGGDLKLRRNGVETSVDMHPKIGAGINLQGVAFYTDTEHKVEPVTKGIRIVLQYDAEVVGQGAKSALGVKGNGEDESEDESEEEDEDESEDLFERVEEVSRKRRYHESSDALTADDAIITKVTNSIADLLASEDVDEVGFALQHLYRKSSIMPEFLKGIDAQLYRALVGSFDLTLKPVVLQSCRDYGSDFKFESHQAVIWEHKTDSGTKSDAPDASDAGSNHPIGSNSKRKKVTFHLPFLSAIQQISHQSYIERTGNESQPEDTKYFGGGMFVRQKEVSKKQ